ncbi:MAG: MFS transporter [Rhodothermales bacterium]|nr:MFS transporter [Rhodothermales bacterium]MBO6780558.1 MFS transporter [Rhodothermales bacterium]
MTDRTLTRPWFWIPTLYFAEGLPYVIVMTVSVVMYSNLGIGNAEVTLYTGWLYLPWVIKPLWSPFVDLIRTKRFWVVSMQLLIGAGLAGVALTLPGDNFFRYSLAFLWLLAFSSATHDIAADGFYMLGLSQGEQSFFVGIRSTFYRLAMLTGQGLLVILAGYLEQSTGNIPLAWSIVFLILAGSFVALAAWHFFAMPRPAEDVPTQAESAGNVWRGFLETFASFFRKPGIGLILAFLLLYRFAEAQLVKVAPLFLVGDVAEGGLGLSTQEFGFVYGTVGLASLTVGGILGGIVASRSGLKAWLWWMVAAINLPNIVYVLLAFTQPDSFIAVNIAVAIEQFGYGFGFTAYMLYMIYVADGPQKTSHFAICTGFMALGMMIPGMFSGAIQEWIGYDWFFVWVLIATIPGFIVAGLVPLDAEFGKKEAT